MAMCLGSVRTSAAVGRQVGRLVARRVGVGDILDKQLLPPPHPGETLLRQAEQADIGGAYSVRVHRIPLFARGQDARVWLTERLGVFGTS